MEEIISSIAKWMIYKATLDCSRYKNDEIPIGFVKQANNPIVKIKVWNSTLLRRKS